MNWFIENCTPAEIGTILVLGVIAVVCIKWFLHTLDELDAQWAADTAMDGNHALVGDMDGHTSCIVDDISASDQDLADLQRGTKL